MWNWKSRELQVAPDGRGLVDLVDLVPFDVQIALTENKGIQTFEVTDIVTDWVNDSFERQLLAAGFTDDERFAIFDSVILDPDSSGRRLLQDDSSWLGLRELQTTQEETDLGVLYTARFGGAALFLRDQDRPLKVPDADVLDMQLKTIRNDEAFLLQAMVDSNAVGLGGTVAAVNAYLNPVRNQEEADDPTNEQLQLVIVIAVIVACVAFLFLVFAIVWAWRYDRRNRAAYLVQHNTKQQSSDDQNPDPTGSDTTFDESPDKSTPPAPDRKNSVDEDISSALSQYYKSGMAGSIAFNDRNSARFNDNASVSSMESYGYSLDGYAPTISTPLPSDAPQSNVGGLVYSARDSTDDEDELMGKP